MAKKQFWLVKQEPESYAWSAFVAEGRAAWTGVRNYQARNNLRAMNEGDLVAYYHSGDGKEVVGLAKVARSAYADPTATDGEWSAVDLVPVKAVKSPVSLSVIKADGVLCEMALVRNSRLSVSPVTEVQFRRLMELGLTRL